METNTDKMAKETASIKTIPEDDLIDPGPEDKVCGLCLKEKSKYTCPRCNMPYCALSCYKSEKHRDCSEMFYKDCFMEGLKDCDVDPDEKRKVMEILSKVENDPDLDDLDGVYNNIEERMDDLDLERDTDKVWDRLTEQEKKEFHYMVTDGRLGSLIEIWIPWWKQNVPVVMEMDQTNKETSIPVIKPNISNIADILKKKPSSDLRYNMINILYAYAYVCRLHNGEHVFMGAESAVDLLSISASLGKGQNFNNVHDAIQSCFSNLQVKDHGFDSTMEQNISIIEDLTDIITCPYKDEPLKYLLSALSDVYEVFKKAHKVKSKVQVKQKKTSDKQDKDKKQFFQCKKKCEFLLSWAQSYGMSIECMLPELDIEYSLLKSDLDLFNQTKSDLEQRWGGKVKPKKKLLVEEL